MHSVTYIKFVMDSELEDYLLCWSSHVEGPRKEVLYLVLLFFLKGNVLLLNSLSTTTPTHVNNSWPETINFVTMALHYSRARRSPTAGNYCIVQSFMGMLVSTKIRTVSKLLKVLTHKPWQHGRWLSWFQRS